jgi:hypothetical protein
VSERILLYIIGSSIIFIVTAFILMTKLMKSELKSRKNLKKSDKMNADMENGIDAAFEELEYYKEKKEDGE